ncbi:ABC transporter ATP-binding protein [Peribacillus sp. V2I11]|uniref:ABC transporter ATP-binding protein n=1 Tax=Peribacillus sp. V2I11 TaxID=3042277 RepID=UPI00278553F9|nr:ATP-binding cassette domain-containing protein [Peribacillus sp. V2I11]MDQ0884718.1 ABC-2 type transport system ATP-binding protein [Peribacillus sp. V2I11]
MSIIEIKNVTKDINGKKILDNINVILSKGQIHGFLGRNGSGKTMLFRAICGLIRPSSGEIIIGGSILHKEISFSKSIGVIIETPGFWNNLTGYENLKLLSEIKKKVSKEDIENILIKVGLDPSDLRTYKKYSLGMKQRLGIAQALMESPEIIILDEPTNALDQEGVELIRNLLLTEKERGATILIASHNKEDIDLLSDKKYKMENGKLTEMN